MNLLAFIPTYNRRQTTAVTFPALRAAIARAPEPIRVTVLVVVSNREDQHLAEQNGFHTVWAPNQPLGRKFNAGLKHALENYQWDYLFQMNSDNLLHQEFWQHFAVFFEKRTPFFGCNHISFFNPETSQALRYLYPDGCGIRFIRRDIAEGAAYVKDITPVDDRRGKGLVLRKGKRKSVPAVRLKPLFGQIHEPPKVELWPPEINIGMDNASHKQIRLAFPDIVQQFPAGNTPMVVDIKSATNLHPFSEFVADSHAKPLPTAEAFQYFPELKYFTHAEV